MPTSARFMWRMNVSAVIQNARMSPSRSQRASSTSRSKRTCSVCVGVKAVKSCVPRSAAAHACSASTSSGRGHHSARPRSKGDSALRVSSR